MININYVKNQKINNIQLVKILFYTFPVWFIVGNLAVSIHCLLFIISSLILIKRHKLKFRFNNLNWLLILFFLYFFISTTIQFQIPGLLNDKIQNWSLENNPIFKAFLLIRFIILIFVIDTLFFNKILNLEKLFLTSLLCTSFVSFDILLQFFTGTDLLGYKSFAKWNSGPFGDEMIAGTYIKNFSFLSIFYIFIKLKNKNYNNSLLIFVIILYLTAALLTGNRMPFVLFLFGCFLIILLIKNLRLSISLSLVIFLPIFLFFVKNDGRVSSGYESFVHDINFTRLFITKKSKYNIDRPNVDFDIGTYVHTNIPRIKSDDKISKEIVLFRHSGYNRIFRTSIEIWKDQPLFGFGLKSFRIKCWELLEKDNKEREITPRPQKISYNMERKITPRPQKISCGNHPHNYYLESLSEAGIIGAFLLIVFFLIILKDSFYFVRKYNQEVNSGIIFLVPIIINVFLEIWPIKSTGSFFTNWGATFFWFNIAILMATNKKKI